MRRMKKIATNARSGYDALLSNVVGWIEQGRNASARNVNAIMTATYWMIGRHIVEFEQQGGKRAGYGQEVLIQLSADLMSRFGRGFGVDNLELFRAFYLIYPLHELAGGQASKSDSAVRISGAAAFNAPKSESVIRKFDLSDIVHVFPLSWTHYVHLIRRTRSPEARRFYEAETLRACPFWMTMMTDGVKAKEASDRVTVKDVAEVLHAAVFGAKESGAGDTKSKD